MNRRVPTWSVPMFFIVGAVSQYVGAALAVFLFTTANPAAVAWLRAAGAAVVLLAWRRPWRRLWTRRGLAVAAGFGIVTVGMNVAFFEAISRIPLGTAVAIEFIGPVAVATLGARRPRDVLAVILATGGVALLAGVQAGANAVGVFFALTAAALWAGYILLGKRVADAGSGLDSLAIGMAVAAVLLAAPLLAGQLHTDAHVLGEPRTWLLGLGVGVSSTAVPYGLDQFVLTVISRARFALLLALLPAAAAGTGAVMLHQWLTVAELAGIALVMAALVISADDSVAEDTGN
ncbi:inner membrane transporter RhtA [Mycolicibacterium sp. BK556]|uniref:EamA family transporter n=1 Tax=unclassified Mycolicibacterium TaxID=2636767 RepID=UPI0018181AC9|nr:inner membrane transporter RhtA [Mycolicibacterium sp. BK556]MBB3630589.1 inner membrane transporter RhtA [Mycolicibacterium sp. BK607]